MLRRIIHSIVAKPAVYDTVQIMVGARRNQRKLALQLKSVAQDAAVLDLGGGTGIHRHLLPESCRYICLDNDIEKLEGFLSKYPRETALLASGEGLPIKDRSLDAILFVYVSHHLSDSVFERLLDESQRVLKPQGQFIMLDAVWDPLRLSGQLLWKYDRGEFPRRPEMLRAMLSHHGEITYWEEFAIFHSYILTVLRPAS